MPKLVSVDDQQPCGLDITISAHYDWSVGKTIDLLFPSSLESKTIDLLFPTSLESQESYLTTGMLPYKRSRSFPQYARLYNAAASPASRLRSAGLVGNYSFVHIQKCLTRLVQDNKFCRILISKTRLVRLF